MNLLLGASAIVLIGLGALIWRARRRPGRAHLFDPPHTPPTVPWRSPPRERGPESARRGEER